jgi:hypothetical protein
LGYHYQDDHNKDRKEDSRIFIIKTPIMPSVTVDVDVDEFDTDDLIEELEHRFDRKRIYKSDLQQLKDFCKKVLQGKQDNEVTDGSLLDNMKLECYLENKEKFTLLELQQALQK